MGHEACVGTQLTGADLKLELRRRAAIVAHRTALANIAGALREGADQREHSRSYGPYAARRATPFKIEDVGAAVVSAGAGQCESSVLATPCFYVWQKMQPGLFCHPVGLAESCSQYAGAGNELYSASHPSTGLVTVPTRCHFSSQARGRVAR